MAVRAAMPYSRTRSDSGTLSVRAMRYSVSMRVA